MKAILALVTALGLLASSGLAAGTDAIIKQHAKDLATQNNNRYNEPSAAQPGQVQSTSGAPAAPVLSPSLSKFQTGLGSLQAGSPASAELQQTFTQQVLAGAQSAKPSPAAVTKFVKDVSEAFADKPLSALNRARLAQSLDAVLNPGKYPQAKLDGIFMLVQTMFHENGLSQTKSQTIADDVKAISGEILHGGAK